MNKTIIGTVLGVIIGFGAVKSNKKDDARTPSSSADQVAIVDIERPDKFPTIRGLYEEIKLQNVLKYEAFEEAMLGHYNIKNTRNRDILTVIDFTLPSTAKRMCVIDLKNKKLLFNTIVSHGKNSGDNFATSFSNRHGSFQSSLGFYHTAETYQGGNGFSLRLDGLEQGVNDQARPRAVVIHGANYCSESFIKSSGRLGRSYGCPALPREVTKPIISTIKNGTLLYIYANDKQYASNSKILKNSAEASKTMLAEVKLHEVELPNHSTLN